MILDRLQKETELVFFFSRIAAAAFEQLVHRNLAQLKNSRVDIKICRLKCRDLANKWNRLDVCD